MVVLKSLLIHGYKLSVEFQALTVMTMKNNNAFRYLTPCSLVDRYQVTEENLCSENGSAVVWQVATFPTDYPNIYIYIYIYIYNNNKNNKASPKRCYLTT